MKIRLGNLLQTKPSAATVGWGTSIAIHATGAVVGVFWSYTVLIHQADFLGKTDSVELAASWEELEDAEVCNDAVATLSVEPLQPDQPIVDVLPPPEWELPPVDVDDCEPPPPPAEPEEPQPQAEAAEPECVCEDDLPREETPPVVVPPDADSRRSEPTPPVPPAAPPVKPPSSPAPRGTVDHLPKKLAGNRDPLYPTALRSRGQGGVVMLEVRISDRGLVEDISVSRSSGFPSLDQAALEGVRRWRFEPARLGDKPVPFVVTLPIRFAPPPPRSRR